MDQLTPRAVFVDGENLANRFADTAKAEGRNPSDFHGYRGGSFVWSPYLTSFFRSRCPGAPIYYFTSATGDAMAIQALESRMKDLGLHPHVRHRMKGMGSKGVDGEIIVTCLDYVSKTGARAVALVSGDGDFVPLVHRLRGEFCSVHLWALSSGLSPELVHAANSADTEALWGELSKSLPVGDFEQIRLHGGHEGGRVIPRDNWRIGEERTVGEGRFRLDPPGDFAVYVGPAR